MTTCPLCLSPLTNKKDEYYYDCGSCKAIVKDRVHYITAEAEKTLYETHNNDVTDVRYQNFTDPITSYVLKEFSPTQKGLDFGSGTGPVISSMLMKEAYDVLQYDPFFAPDQSVFEQKYDYIFSCEVFEHFHHPKVEIDRLVDLLKAGGSLLIMTLIYNDELDFKKWYYRNDPTHIFIYRKKTIEYIAQEKGLEIVVLTDRFIVLRKG